MLKKFWGFLFTFQHIVVNFIYSLYCYFLQYFLNLALLLFHLLYANQIFCVSFFFFVQFHEPNYFSYFLFQMIMMRRARKIILSKNLNPFFRCFLVIHPPSAGGFWREKMAGKQADYMKCHQVVACDFKQLHIFRWQRTKSSFGNVNAKQTSRWGNYSIQNFTTSF